MKLGGDGPQALVICPTRELAMQVAGEAERFGEDLGVRTVLAYGGTSSGEQKRLLAEGCDLVVGTPGRLLDFVNSAWLSLRKLRFLVLDEADRMLDMGFINDVDAILRRTPMSRQTMLFSATIPEEIRALAERYMFDPAVVRMHRGTRVKASVDHAFYPVPQSQKTDLLVEILRREKPAKFLDLHGHAGGHLRAGAAPAPAPLRGDLAVQPALPGQPRAGADGVSQRGVPGAGRHRRGRARPGHHRHRPGGQLRRPDAGRGLRAPHRPDRAGGAGGQGGHPGLRARRPARRRDRAAARREGAPRRAGGLRLPEAVGGAGRTGRIAPGAGARGSPAARGPRGRRGAAAQEERLEHEIGALRGRAAPVCAPAFCPVGYVSCRLIEIFEAGGPIMWPLALCSLVALAIIIERLINLRFSRVLNPAIVERVTALAEGGRIDRAIEVCRQNPGIYTNIVLAGPRAGRTAARPLAKEAVEDAGRHETARLNRYLGTLGTIVGISPLLGLLGTVTGMIEVFNTIAKAGAGQAAQLSSGISQALITTATGLLIAIPALVAYNFFQEKAEAIVADLERESLRVLRGLYHSDDGVRPLRRPDRRAGDRDGGVSRCSSARSAGPAWRSTSRRSSTSSSCW